MSVAAPSTLRSLRTLDRTAIRWEAGLLGVAIAVAAALCVGLDVPDLALTAAIAIAFQGLILATPGGPPARAVIVAVPLVAGSVLVAGLTSTTAAGRLVSCTVIAAAGGLATAWGRRAGSVGMVCAVVATIYAGQPVSTDTALQTAALYAACSCVPLALLAIPAVRRGLPLTPAPPPHLRSLLLLPSATRRHACRYAVGIAIATSLALLDPASRSFWVPMTVAWVLKPDTGVTNRVVLHRIVGTFIGVGTIYALTDWLGISGMALAIVGAAMGALFVGFVFAHYATATAGVTGLVISMIALAGGPLGQTLRERMVDTTIGGVLTLLILLLWRDRQDEPELPAEPSAPEPPGSPAEADAPAH